VLKSGIPRSRYGRAAASEDERGANPPFVEYLPFVPTSHLPGASTSPPPFRNGTEAILNGSSSGNEFSGTRTRLRPDGRRRMYGLTAAEVFAGLQPVISNIIL
jgi:hypothetical protein